MADEEFPREDELEGRQAAALYPVGRALRTTFDAENHDSLGNDLTGLMLELAHIDPDAPPLPRPVVPPLASTPVPIPPIVAAEASTPAGESASWWRSAVDKLMR
ncbi:MAG: hypothetical protein JWN21_2673 [Sphingomonas bacterium]|uniref:hypothetical protein n=1 Tax=Sphingomonas bacterium TaxID=1895847 RepID=UPI00261367F1|nr:hypothetical protein [Sphingomonas bacterium]MDB5697130.1 hypothetical protein [Sphingomonas bacterium]